MLKKQNYIKYCITSINRSFSSNNNNIRNRNRCLVFPGQGAQYIGMTKDIYNEFNYIKELIQECDDIIGYSLSNIMFNGDINELTQTIKAQPAVLIHSLSLLKVLQNEYNLFKSNSNDFQIAMGLSLGEYSALTSLQCFNSVKDAIFLVDKRANAMQKCCINNNNNNNNNNDNDDLQQKMLAIMHDGSLTIEKLQEIIDNLDIDKKKYVADIANYNSSRQVVISGHKYSLDIIQNKLKIINKKYKSKYINTGGAFHSSLMLNAKNDLEFVLKNININLPFNNNTLISNVNSTIINKNNYSSSDIIKELLCLQVCSSVNWYPSIIKAIKQFNVNEFIEIGPKSTISAMIRDICKINDIQDIKILNFDKLEDFEKNVKLIV